jgi:hypothetical protein
MWNWLASCGNYFLTILMPARFSRAAIESRATRYVERTTDRWQHPDQRGEMAAGDKAREQQQKDAAEQAREEGQAASGQGQAQRQPATFASRLWVVVRWVLHFVLVALILVGLYFLNRWLGLEKLLRSDWPQLHPYWLPLLFLIVYVLLWLGGWLWSLTGPDHIGDDFPDLNQAWDLAVSTLYRSGIDLRQAPVFLVLGRTESPPHELFDATLRLRVSAPQGSVLPLRVYASQDRVFITCPGASLLARQARTLTQQSYDTELAPADSEQGTAVEETAQAGKVLQGQAAPEAVAAATPAAAPGAGAASAQPQTGGAVGVAEADEPLSEEDQRVLGLLQTEGLGTGERARKMTTSFLKDPAEVRVLTARLQYLCRLIRRDRKPYCPINGILVLVPHAALEDDLDASQTATACRLDLQVIRQTLQVQCPVFALVCDMERSEGFRQFLYRLPGRQNISRLGQRFPLYPDVDEHEIPRLVDTGTSWLTNALLPSLVYNLFRLETPPGVRGREVAPAEALTENSRLYDFLWEMRDQRRRLSRLLARGLLLDQPRAYYFGGVYLAGTGQNMSAFIPGVFLRLLQNQNFLSWTPQALAAERRYRSWAWVLFVINLVLLIGGPLLAYLFWPR